MSALALHTKLLVCLARDLPALRGAALRSCLAQLSCFEGRSCDALVTAQVVPEDQARPLEILDLLLTDLATADAERALLCAEISAEKEKHAQLHFVLQSGEVQRRALEEERAHFLVALQDGELQRRALEEERAQLQGALQGGRAQRRALE